MTCLGGHGSRVGSDTSGAREWGPPSANADTDPGDVLCALSPSCAWSLVGASLHANQSVLFLLTPLALGALVLKI